MAVSFEAHIENHDGLIDPIVITRRFDICPICKAQRLELMSFNNYPQNYKAAIDAYLSGYRVEFNKYEIRSMRCRSCNREFVIDWTSGFPVPLDSTFKTNRFFAEFADGY